MIWWYPWLPVSHLQNKNDHSRLLSASKFCNCLILRTLIMKSSKWRYSIFTLNERSRLLSPLFKTVIFQRKEILKENDLYLPFLCPSQCLADRFFNYGTNVREESPPSGLIPRQCPAPPTRTRGSFVLRVWCVLLILSPSSTWRTSQPCHCFCFPENKTHSFC